MRYKLCKACARREKCTYRGGRKDVYCCDEFDGERVRRSGQNREVGSAPRARVSVPV